MEEFDNLPDSYFSPKEWEKFLKLRGNEMWINIAIECSEFRIEHKEEYEKFVKEIVEAEVVTLHDFEKRERGIQI